MGCGISSSCSESTSKQIANANIAQQFSGTCKITCQNAMNDVRIQFFNSSTGNGGINVTQSCAVNGQCVIGNNSTAVADVLFKAANSATAGSTAPFLGAGNSSNSTYQEINQNIQEYATENCEVAAVNTMNNVDIYAANSFIGGGIQIGQNGVTNGNCALSNVMNAATHATGLSDNCAAAGKSSKKKACAGKGSFGSLLLFGIVGVIAFVILMMVFKYFRGTPSPPCEKPDGTFLAQGPCRKPDGTLLPVGVKYTPTRRNNSPASVSPMKTPTYINTPVMAEPAEEYEVVESPVENPFPQEPQVYEQSRGREEIEMQ